MQSKHTQKIVLSDQQRKDLELIVRRRKSSQSLVLRAKIILAGAEGKSLLGTAKKLKCTRETVTRWRKHWVERPGDQSTLEKLKEAQRPGTPPKFTAEQICQIIALSCDKPEDHGYPFSHWSESLLAMVAVDKKIVSSISQRQVGRFLKSGRHSSRQGQRLG
ncbi:helix-turn-helix domain-containing protein [Endozoicomonas montiporae]|uniref:IS630 family transposase n=3 Tax=Endozoicomonas montiporae TaxID=1027273 RepID=A0A142B753_9GAMM|nr:helix-turn-helix domain-containing protein [Endozoicomonas montiporae]AMO54579.1 IS630 family transposase [Endozoicomonas montiporae CL-33]